MKAEVGFVRCWEDGASYGKVTDRLVLVVQAQSRTEGTALMAFAKRMGWQYEVASDEIYIEEPAAEVKP